MNNIKKRHITLILILFVYLNSFSQDSISRDKIKVYKSLQKALRHPEKVRALDLSGQKLKELPTDIAKFQNLELLWLGPRHRNLWFYPKAWPYKFFGRHLPAGGYAHLQGRGRGKFIFNNYLDSLPVEFFSLKKLKFIDIRHNSIDNSEWVVKLKSLNAEMIILSYSYKPWVIVEAEFIKSKKCLDHYELK
jgi:hypothetical protein